MANYDAIKSGTSANSYATIEEADDFYELQYGSDEWFDVSDDDKEKLLVTATTMIDGLKPRYDKLDDTQALNFPMSTGDSDDDGYAEAKQATITQALYIYKNFDAIQEARQSALTGTKSESLGKVSRQMTGYNSTYSFDAMALQRLAPYTIQQLSVSR